MQDNSDHERRKAAHASIILVPVGMRRPAVAGQALRRSPLVHAGGADSSRVECVPCVAAVTRPEVVLAG
jgi:hypothetical protein